MSRDNILSDASPCSRHFLYNHILAFLQAFILRHLFLLFPALTCGCSDKALPSDLTIETPVVSTNSVSSNGIEISDCGSALDIFTFENDRLGRLDSYKRIEEYDGNMANIESTGGSKRVFFCLNGQRGRYDWSDICSYWSLDKIYVNLEKERADRPTMTGECICNAGESSISTEMKALICEIKIERISCDFSGTSYATSTLRNVRAYLINVSATCPILYNQYYRPIRIINVETLNPLEVKEFTDPSNIISKISVALGKQSIFPDIRFICYPNNGDDKTASSQCTRLVIEGEIEGNTYYWPITVNNGLIERNKSYSYDIQIKRKGVTDPNTPIDTKDLDFVMNILPWTEAEEYGVIF